MPGKSRRVASRQAQLSRKRKKGPKGTSDAVPAPAAPVEVDGKQAEVAPGVVPEPPRPAPPPTPRRPSPVASRTEVGSEAPARTPARARGERPPTQNYIGAEVRRILLMGGVVLAVIIALGVVL